METNKKFKPFQKVLIKDGDSKWQIDLYSHWDSDSENHITMSYGGGLEITDEDILPYECNEELVGTIDEPETEVRLEEGEWCIFFDNFEWVKEGEHGVLRRLQKLNGAWFFDYNRMNWKYAIRFKDFNPNDMEETKKHILCVKNGKIVKYKG